jgi:siroheme synthase-like protein
MMLPLAFDLRDRDVLVLGMGRIGRHKAEQLLGAGARVHVITDALLVEPPTGLASLQIRPYAPGDLDGFWLVVSATADKTVNDRVVAEANERRVIYNVVDDLERCMFYYMALHRDGDMTVAVSSSGATPALAQWVRNRVRECLPVGLGDVATQLRSERTALHRQGLSSEIDWSDRLSALLSTLNDPRTTCHERSPGLSIRTER